MNRPGSAPADFGGSIGVVVIGRNEGERLVRCLASLAQVRDRVVYVDSGSTDGSIAAALAAGAQVVELETARAFTAARARNAGFAELLARFPDLKYVQFIDGDCELDAGWLPAAHAFLDDRADVAAVCGRRRERHPEASPYNAMCDLEWNTPVGEAVACGGDALMRVSAFRSVGGFDDTLMAGEEPELCRRLRSAGHLVWRLDQEMTLHDAAMTRLGQWWKRSVRGGYGYAHVWSVTRRTPEPLYGREVGRAALWGGAVPLGAGLAALVHPLALAAPIGIYAAQIARIALRRGARDRSAWIYGAFAVLAKFPELQGLLRYLRAPAKRRPQSSITYK